MTRRLRCKNQIWASKYHSREKLILPKIFQDCGKKLSLTQLTINTAIVYMHRFFMMHSFKVRLRNHLWRHFAFWPLMTSFRYNFDWYWRHKWANFAIVSRKLVVNFQELFSWKLWRNFNFDHLWRHFSAIWQVWHRRRVTFSGRQGRRDSTKATTRNIYPLWNDAPTKIGR